LCTFALTPHIAYSSGASAHLLAFWPTSFVAFVLACFTFSGVGHVLFILNKSYDVCAAKTAAQTQWNTLLHTRTPHKKWQGGSKGLSPPFLLSASFWPCAVSCFWIYIYFSFFYLLLMNSIYAKWFGFAFEKGNLNTFCKRRCIFYIQLKK